MKNILVITYWSYKDALIQTYTLPYLRIIRQIVPGDSRLFLVTFENKLHSISSPEAEKIKQQLESENILWVSYSYSPAGITALLGNMLAIVTLLSLCISNKITHIHAWCTPAGSIGYILSKLTRAQLIIDSYEPHAEAMIENGTWKAKSIAFKTLFWFEKKQSKHASIIIATTNGMKQYAKEKFNVTIKTFFVKPACVDLDLFSYQKYSYTEQRIQHGLNDKIICIYAGKFGGIYLEQPVFDFLKVAYDFWGDKFNVLLLTDASEKTIKAFARKSNLDEKIITSTFVAHKEIPKYLAMADFAINPVKPVATKRYCTSIKDGEYWAMGLPVVIPLNISDDSDIIEKNNIGAVLQGLNEEEYLIAVHKIDELITSKDIKKIKDKIISIAQRYRNTTIAEKVYQSIYA